MRSLQTVKYLNNLNVLDAQIETSRNGKYLSLVYHREKILKILKISNSNLNLKDEDEIEYLHPLGSLEKIFELKADQIAWHSDLSQFACQTYIGVNLIGGDPKPSISVYVIDERNSKTIMIHRVK